MLELNGERWPLTPEDGLLHIYLDQQLQTLPEAWWYLEFGARRAVPSGRSEPAVFAPSLHLSIYPVFVPIRHWRDLAGWELHANPDWQDAHEFIDEDGDVRCSLLELYHWPGPSLQQKSHHWVGEEYRFRFGSREGTRFVFELEGWVEPDEQYYQTAPRSTAAAAGVPRGTPPNLWLMTQIQFARFTVETPASAHDPIAWAEQKVRRTFGVCDLTDPILKPRPSRPLPDQRSTAHGQHHWEVSFTTTHLD